jgi:hypothetical protein
LVTPPVEPLILMKSRLGWKLIEYLALTSRSDPPMDPKLVYLDSNDFSDLSRSENELSGSDKAILELLRDAKRNGRARFFISPIHISEAVHASEKYKDAAVRRATLMQELGAGNILQFPLNICKRELDRAFATEDKVQCSLAEITSKPDEWFGISSPIDDLKERRKEVSAVIDGALRGLNRAGRRTQKSKLNPEKKSSHAYIRSIVKEGLSQSSPSNIPVALMNPDLALDWYLGKASNEALRKNSVGLLSDPYLLFKYFIDELGHRESLYRVIRDQGEKWVSLVETATSQAIPLLVLAKQVGSQLDLNSILSQITSESFWQKVIGSLAEIDLSHLSGNEIKDAKDKSPSTSIFIHILLESIRVKLQSTAARVNVGNLKPPSVKTSDYADFMHVIYAPYFDIFRCDTRTGELLGHHRLTSGRIASKRNDLLNML